MSQENDAKRAASKLESIAQSDAADLISDARHEAERVKAVAEHAANELVANAARQISKDAEAKRNLDASLKNALHEFFDASDQNGVKQFLNQDRIPLICESIKAIERTLNNHDIIMTKIVADLTILKKIIYGAIAVILLGFCGIAWIAIVNFLKVPH